MRSTSAHQWVMQCETASVFKEDRRLINDSKWSISRCNGGRLEGLRKLFFEPPAVLLLVNARSMEKCKRRGGGPPAKERFVTGGAYKSGL